MKRLLSWILVTILLVSTFPLISLAESTPKIKIVFSELSVVATDDKKALFEKYVLTPMAEAFPECEIIYEPFSDRQTLAVQIAGGGGPDYMLLDGVTDAVEYAKAGRIVDLTAYSAKYGWEDQVFPWAYKTAVYDGKLYSIPNSFEGMVIYFNEKVFRDNGWVKPQNAGDLVTLCEEALKKGIVPFAFGNSDYQGAVDWLYSSFLSCYASPAVMKEVLTGTKKFTEPLVKESVQLMVDWWKAGYFGNRMSQALTTTDMVAQFANGDAAMMIDGTWAVGDLMNVYKDCEWSLDLIPELREGVGKVLPLATGGVYVINAASKNPDKAAEIIDWLLFKSVDRHIESVEKAKYQPYPIKAFDTSKFTSGIDPQLTALYATLMGGQESGNVGYCSWTFFPSAARVYMNEQTDALFLDLLSVDEYLETVQGFVDAAIASGTAPVIP